MSCVNLARLKNNRIVYRYKINDYAGIRIKLELDYIKSMKIWLYKEQYVFVTVEQKVEDTCHNVPSSAAGYTSLWS